MRVAFTYWKAPDGKYLGYLHPHPNHWTQGESVEELKEILRDLYQMFSAEDIPGIRQVSVLDIEG